MDAYLQDQGHIDRIEHRRTVDELAAQITELAGHLNAANYRFLMLIAEFDRCNGWRADRVYSCAHWLNWKCGIALGAAREKVRTALALAKLPKIAEAMQRGQLSYSKVRAITRVACEKTEEYFLAEHPRAAVRTASETLAGIGRKRFPPAGTAPGAAESFSRRQGVLLAIDSRPALRPICGEPGAKIVVALEITGYAAAVCEQQFRRVRPA
jgi:hypothetical protein